MSRDKCHEGGTTSEKYMEKFFKRPQLNNCKGISQSSKRKLRYQQTILILLSQIIYLKDLLIIPSWILHTALLKVKD